MQLYRTPQPHPQTEARLWFCNAAASKPSFVKNSVLRWIRATQNLEQESHFAAAFFVFWSAVALGGNLNPWLVWMGCVFLIVER